MVLEVLVRGDKHLKPRRFCCRDEFAILQRGPTTLEGGFHRVTSKHSAKRSRSALIEQDFHLRYRHRTPGHVLQHGAHLIERHAREPLDKLMG